MSYVKLSIAPPAGLDARQVQAALAALDDTLTSMSPAMLNRPDRDRPIGARADGTYEVRVLDPSSAWMAKELIERAGCAVVREETVGD